MTDDERGDGLTRRDFLRNAGLATVAGLAGLRLAEGAEEALFAAKRPLATVVLVRDQAALKGDGSAEAEVVRAMVSRGVRALQETEDEKAAWGQLFKASDAVGIKYSRCGWMSVPTRQEVIDAVGAGLQLAGVPKDKLHAEDYGLPAEQCTALVSVTSLKAHPLTGIAASIKNYINFHPKPDSFHHENSSKLGEIWLRPEVKGKTRLVVLDLLTPYFGTGPQIDPRYRADYRGVLVATDPVAADTVALRLCQLMRDRHRRKPWPVTPPPLFLAAADKEYHLGTADPARIKLVRLGWTDHMLV
jgi:hypothetical protein